MHSYNHKTSTRSLYIHWPFCPYRCNFCPFVALASHDQFMERYHKALCAEIKQFGRNYKQKLPLDTIFMGGGTPSTYPDALLLDMFGTLKETFDFNQATEVTIEVNPGTVRIEQLALWKKIGINRLSIGVQSLKDSVLKGLNRHQTAESVFFLLEHAKEYFDNISVDLILGLPGVSEREWQDLLHTVVTWPIRHMSMYFLMVHENTILYFKVKTNKVTLPCDDSVVDLYHWSHDFLHEHGFERYELSNFSHAGYESRHNTVYWERKPYRGFGLGASSFDGQSRFQNEKNLMKYLEGAENGKDVTVFSEELTKQQMHLEKIMLGLRRVHGITWKAALEDLSIERQEEFKKNIAWLQHKNFIVERDGTLALTPAGLVVENEIVAKLSL